MSVPLALEKPKGIERAKNSNASYLCGARLGKEWSQIT